MGDADFLLAFDGVGRAFPGAAGPVPVLHDVTFAVRRGEAVALLGRSGSGKSTLLHLAAGIDVPTVGRVRFEGRDLAALPDAERTKLRRGPIGLVFQFFHLLPHLTVLENVLLPASIAGRSGEDATRAARELLARVDLVTKEREFAGVLSGGEQQRVALCRALIGSPRLLLADEPTGNLDDASAARVMDLLLGMARQHGAALLFVTHDRELAARANRVLTIHSGRLEPSCSARS